MITLVDRRHATTALRTTAIVFVIAVLLHNGDHFRRGGDSVSALVFWLGSAGMILEVGVVALVLGRHRLAPIAAAVVGASLAIGYGVVHFTPRRDFFSDSFIGTHAATVSIMAAGLEMGAAVALAAAGVVALRSGVADEDGSPPLRDLFGHPLVLLFAAGNLVIFIGSLATR